MKNKKLIRTAPFMVWGIAIVYTWVVFLFGDYSPTFRHIAALVLFLVNLYLYFTRFKTAVVLTGVLLLLATFNLLASFPAILSTSYFIRFDSNELGIPGGDLRTLLILISYFAINMKFLFGLYLDYKGIKEINADQEKP